MFRYKINANFIKEIIEKKRYTYMIQLFSFDLIKFTKKKWLNSIDHILYLLQNILQGGYYFQIMVSLFEWFNGSSSPLYGHG